MSRRLRRGRHAAVGAAATVALLVPGGPAPAGGQTAPGLDLVDQTVFVDDDPAWITVAAPDAPDDASLALTIYENPRTDRQAVRDSHADPPNGGDRIAAFQCTLDGDCFDQATLESGADDEFTITLDDTVIGESLRRSTGALVVVVELVTDDEVVDRIVTNFVVLDDLTDRRIRIGFTAAIDAPLAHDVDQTVTVDAAALLDAAEAVPADLPVTFALHPESLTALEAVDPDGLDELIAAIDGRPVLRAPWVAMDEEAWRTADQGDRVITLYAVGSDTVETVLGGPPSEVARIDADAGPGTLSLLRAAGVAAVIIDDARIATSVADTAAERPVTMLDDNGVAMTGLRYDEALIETLAHPDPELAAIRAVTELITGLYDDSTPWDIATLLDADRIEPDTLEAFLDLVDGRREFEVTDVASLATLDPERLGGTAPRVALRPTPAPDASGLVDDLRAGRAAIDTLRAMLAPETDGIAALETQLLAATSSELTPDDAARYPARVVAEVVERTSGIEVPQAERVTLTDRRTDLPLRVVNNQPVALNVELVLSAEKLRFPDGDRQTLRLFPGDNELVIPVETLASGDARVTATIVTPGGTRELAVGTVDIRSTAISGLGLAISVVALLILGAWWIRTILRIRRNRAAATVAAASDDDPATPTGDPVDPVERES